MDYDPDKQRLLSSTRHDERRQTDFISFIYNHPTSHIH